MILQQTIQPIGCPIGRMPDTALGAVNHDIAKQMMGKEVGVHFTLRCERSVVPRTPGNAGIYRLDRFVGQAEKLCEMHQASRWPVYTPYRSMPYILGRGVRS